MYNSLATHRAPFTHIMEGLRTQCTGSGKIRKKTWKNTRHDDAPQPVVGWVGARNKCQRQTMKTQSDTGSRRTGGVKAWALDVDADSPAVLPDPRRQANSIMKG